jgi:hypothetical protein
MQAEILQSIVKKQRCIIFLIQANYIFDINDKCNIFYLKFRNCNDLCLQKHATQMTLLATIWKKKLQTIVPMWTLKWVDCMQNIAALWMTEKRKCFLWFHNRSVCVLSRSFSQNKEEVVELLNSTIQNTSIR